MFHTTQLWGLESAISYDSLCRCLSCHVCIFPYCLNLNALYQLSIREQYDSVKQGNVHTIIRRLLCQICRIGYLVWHIFGKAPAENAAEIAQWGMPKRRVNMLFLSTGTWLVYYIRHVKGVKQCCVIPLLLVFYLHPPLQCVMFWGCKSVFTLSKWSMQCWTTTQEWHCKKLIKYIVSSYVN